MQFNLFRLKQQLENLRGEDISWAEISRETGIQPNTLSSLLRNKARRVDLTTLQRLLTYFNRQGLSVGPGDLFVVRGDG